MSRLILPEVRREKYKNDILVFEIDGCAGSFFLFFGETLSVIDLMKQEKRKNKQSLRSKKKTNNHHQMK